MNKLSRILLACTLAALFTACHQEQEKKPEVAIRQLSIKMVHDSSTASLLASLAEDFQVSNPQLPDGSQVKIELIARSGMKAASEIASGALKADAWLAPSSSLINYTNSHITNLGAKQVDCLQLFATPLVFATLEGSLYQVNAKAQEFSWNEMIEGQLARRQQDSSAALISLTHSKPDSVTSGLAALAQLAWLSEYRQSGDLVMEALGSKQSLDRLAQYESFALGYGQSDSDVLSAAASAGNGKTVLALATEQQLALYNQRRAPATQKLVALYPREGSYWEDHSFCFSSADWVTPAHRAALQLWLDFLKSEKAQYAARTAGYRTSIHQFSEAAPLVPDMGVNTTLPRQSLRPVSGQVAEYLLKIWPEVMRPLALIVALDTSGSMETALAIGKDELRVWAASLSPRDRIALLSFASAVNQSEIFSDAGSFIKALDSTRSLGGSAVYDGLRRALDLASDAQLKSHRKVVLLYTDGGDKYSQTSLNLLTDLIHKKQSTEDLNLIVVALHQGDPHFADLESIAQAGRAHYQAISPHDVPVAMRAMIERY